MVHVVSALGRMLVAFAVCVCLLQIGTQARHVRHGHGILEPSNALKPDAPAAAAVTTVAAPPVATVRTTEADAAEPISTESVATDGAAAGLAAQPSVAVSTPAAENNQPPAATVEAVTTVAPEPNGQAQRFRHVREDIVPHSDANASAAPALNPPDATTFAPQAANAVTPNSAVTDGPVPAAATTEQAPPETTQSPVANDAEVTTAGAPVDSTAALPPTGLGSKFVAEESLVSGSLSPSNSSAKHSNASLALPGGAEEDKAGSASAVARTTNAPAVPDVSTPAPANASGAGDSSEVDTPPLKGADVVSANGTAADEAKFKRIFTKTVPSDGEGNAGAQNSASSLRTTPKPHASVITTEQVDLHDGRTPPPTDASLPKRNQSHHNAKFAQAKAKVDTTTASPGFDVIPTLVERPETIKTWPQASIVPAGAVAAAQHFLKMAAGDTVATPEKVFGINSQKDDLVEVASPNTLPVDSESQL